MCTATSWNHKPEDFLARFPMFGDTAVPEYAQLMIRPTEKLLVGRSSGNGPSLELLPFGVVSPELPVQRRVVNARVENLRRSPFWRKLLAGRRCVVAISGFYESRRRDGLEVYRFGEAPVDAGGKAFLPSALAGLWDETGVVVITRPAEGAVSQVHDRMPAALRPESLAQWLEGDGEDASALLKDAPPLFSGYRIVDDAFKRGRNDPALLQEFRPPPRLEQGALW